ncbi:hypothetical protein [Paenibacillus sp. FSL K6-2524]|uniref:hypothetical protein n=1 Tax=Paenibacillus sp. FSL K6-2524 TaxID=2954516 RepID=UPI0030F9225F
MLPTVGSATADFGCESKSNPINPMRQPKDLKKWSTSLVKPHSYVIHFSLQFKLHQFSTDLIIRGAAICLSKQE